MNSACKAWIVATSIAAVETLKDQGVCRWNFVIRSMQQHAKNNIRSYYQAKKLSAQSSSAISNTIKRSKEDSMRKVMDLSCWGPNTIRFYLQSLDCGIKHSCSGDPKDRGVCKWNFVIRSMHQHAKNNIRSYYQAKKLSAHSSSAISNTIMRSKEVSMRKVLDLSCWGPNTIRF
ncbi:hypothetical protein SO802_014842 [Lithocarpus litseifolius]